MPFCQRPVARSFFAAGVLAVRSVRFVVDVLAGQRTVVYVWRAPLRASPNIRQSDDSTRFLGVSMRTGILELRAAMYEQGMKSFGRSLERKLGQNQSRCNAETQGGVPWAVRASGRSPTDSLPIDSSGQRT